MPLSSPERRFLGMPDRVRCLPVPLPFLGSLLAEIDTLAELKVTLCLWRLLQERPPSRRFARRSELLGNRSLLRSLRPVDRARPEKAVEAGLRAACRRGTLLSVPWGSSPEADEIYVFNTPSNRRFVERLRTGEVQDLPASPEPDAEAREPQARPDIFELYEENIGLLTPLLVEELHEAEQKYPQAWVREAFREAVSYNKRSWRYVQRVLENWASHGRGQGGETGRGAGPFEDSRRYRQGRYGHLIKH